MFSAYLDRWHLTPDGDPIVTGTSRLLPVICQDKRAMLKIAIDDEEELGNKLMAWWDSQGVPRVLAIDGKAILLERAQDDRPLANLVQHGRDDEATHIICAVVGKLHSPKGQPRPHLIPLAEWFGELGPTAHTQGGIFSLAAATADDLLSGPREITVLHGDIHHENILKFGDRGWLAIDPKGLIGERGFDYANLFCNPDAETATDQDRFRRRVEMVTETACLNRARCYAGFLRGAGCQQFGSSTTILTPRRSGWRS